MKKLSKLKKGFSSAAIALSMTAMSVDFNSSSYVIFSTADSKSKKNKSFRSCRALIKHYPKLSIKYRFKHAALASNRKRGKECAVGGSGRVHSSNRKSAEKGALRNCESERKGKCYIIWSR